MDWHGGLTRSHAWAWSLLIAALVFVGDMTLHRMGLHEHGWEEAATFALLALGAALIAQGVRSLWHTCEHDHRSVDLHH